MDLIPRVLLSIQRALVGEITPEMRAIEVEISPAHVLVRVFVDGVVPDSVRDDFDAGAISQVVADFAYPEGDDPVVDLEFVRCDAPSKVPVRGILVFARVGTLFEVIHT